MFIIMNNKEFIINGKLYSTEGSLLLCKSTDACFGEIAVYHTKKARFSPLVLRSLRKPKSRLSTVRRL